MKLHETEEFDCDQMRNNMRLAVPGGWLYILSHIQNQYTGFAAAPPVFVPDLTAPHCRPKVRRFTLQKGASHNPTHPGEHFWHSAREGVTVCHNLVSRVWVIMYPDNSDAFCASREEAHDALGPDSPWVEVTE
jgi:hypothetical protein